MAAPAGIQPPAPHPKYRVYREQWERCRDVWRGRDAVRAKREHYLPKLGFGEDEYEAYLNRATWRPAFRRTVQAVVGAMFREPPLLTNVPDSLVSDMEDIDLRGTPLNLFVMELALELANQGRAAIELDAHAGRIFWKLHKAEAVTSWWEDTWAGPPHLRWVSLIQQETVPDDKSPSRLALSLSNRFYQHLQRGADVTLDIYKPAKGYTIPEPTRWGVPLAPASIPPEWNLDATKTPGFSDGGSLERIPVWIVNASSAAADPETPPMLSLADLNLSHFRASADFEHGTHFSALPTPWVSGEETLENPTIGSSEILQLGAHGTAGYMEVRGPGLNALRAGLAEKVEDMAQFGGQFFAPELVDRETATSSRIRTGTHSSTLMQMLSRIEQTVTTCLEYHAKWASVPVPEDKPITFSLNRRFFESRIDPQHAVALFKMLQSHALSYDTFYAALQQGEWIDPNATPEQERQRIKKDREERLATMPNLPVPPNQPPPNPNDPPPDPESDP